MRVRRANTGEYRPGSEKSPLNVCTYRSPPPENTTAVSIPPFVDAYLQLGAHVGDGTLPEQCAHAACTAGLRDKAWTRKTQQRDVMAQHKGHSLLLLLNTQKRSRTSSWRGAGLCATLSSSPKYLASCKQRSPTKNASENCLTRTASPVLFSQALSALV